MDTIKETSITYTLEFPVQLSDKVLTEITVRRPVLKDSMKHNISEKSTLTEIVKFVSELCDINVEDLSLLDLSDWENLQQEVLRFRDSTA